MDKLHILTGSLQGAVVELIGDEITVGRSSDNAICLDDESVSEHHATLKRHGRDWVVCDAGSATGTFVRDGRIVTARLEDGDKVAFGSVKLLFETSEKKLHLFAEQSSVQASSRNVARPLLKGPEAGTKGSSYISAAIKLVQLVVFVAVAGGSYWVYQKLNSMAPLADAPPPDNAKATPLAPPPKASAQAVPISPPVPATNQQMQFPADQPGSGVSTVTSVQPAAAIPATRPCTACNGTGAIRCRWCNEGQVDCPGPCLKLSRGTWQHLDVAGHDPKELWQKFYNSHGGYRAWSQGHVGQVVVMQNGEPVNIGPCTVCNGTAHVACTHCRGTGKFVCPTCQGTGSVPRSQSYAVPAQR